MKKKILIFYTKAGAGHQSTANSLAKEILVQYPDANVECIDLAYKNLELQQKPFIDIYNWFIDIYNWLIEDGKFFWWFLNVVTKTKVGAGLFLWIPGLFWNNSKLSQTLEDEIVFHKPDMIISCCYFVAGQSQEVCAGARLNCEIVTVVSDIFGAHPIWFTSKTTKYMVFSEKIYNRAIKYVNPNLVTKFNYFFNSKFEKALNAEQITSFKTKIELDNFQKTILILAGGNGLPNGNYILEELLKNQELQAQIVVVTGRNQKLLEKCQIIIDNYYKNGGISKVKLFGFRNDVYELMNSADLIIAKAGPATVLEAVALHKPLFLCHYIWEQETDNKDWVVENNYGVYEANPQKLGELVVDYLNSPKNMPRFNQIELKSSSETVTKSLMEMIGNN